MSEFDLIAMIKSATALERIRSDVVLGIGDDAALTRVPPRHELATAIDTLVDGVHFPRGTAPAAIGWKALAVNLSDLAAMGATPAWATLALTLPAGDRKFVARFARGFAALAAVHRVALIGGDTTRGPLSITVQVSGFVPARKALRRDGARAGDAVFVTGTLGDAAAALRVSSSALQRRLDRPTPRVAEGLALRNIAHSCIDVSDGLAADLSHVLAASAVGAELDCAALPASRALVRAVPDRDARLALQLSGGDDYELCFTADPKHATRLAAFATRIGTITARRGLRVRGAPAAAATKGWDHFR
jgi:thiamine-monophosphate kinase